MKIKSGMWIVVADGARGLVLMNYSTQCFALHGVSSRLSAALARFPASKFASHPEQMVG